MTDRDGNDRTDQQEDPDRPRIKVTDRRFRAEADAGEVASQPAEALSSDTDAGDRDLRTELEEARAKANEYLDHLRRLQAEFDNFRKRTLKEQTRAVELAAQPVAQRLLEVLDDFELALMAAEQKPSFEKFRKGVELVYAKFFDALRAEGLERIDAEGKPFDPMEQEALMQTGEGTGEPVVAEVFRPGYRLKGHVIRPAQVRVERS
jgi:molecular chaperone GrpE